MRLILTLTALLAAPHLSASANRSHDDCQRESEAVKGSPK